MTKNQQLWLQIARKHLYISSLKENSCLNSSYLFLKSASSFLHLLINVRTVSLNNLSDGCLLFWNSNNKLCLHNCLWKYNISFPNTALTHSSATILLSLLTFPPVDAWRNTIARQTRALSFDELLYFSAWTSPNPTKEASWEMSESGNWVACWIAGPFGSYKFTIHLSSSFPEAVQNKEDFSTMSSSNGLFSEWVETTSFSNSVKIRKLICS